MVDVSRGIRGLDNESAIMIYKGLTISQLCEILGMDRRLLTSKIEENNIKPSGTNQGFPIYKLKEVMPYVVKPAYDVEEYLSRMNPQDLPKHLSKEFWAGQRSKQEFMLKNGDLHPTKDVVEALGDIFKLVKSTARLTVDTVERRAELTADQRNAIIRIMDGMLLELHKKITEKFRKPGARQEASSDDEL